jgi:UDP-glucose 4,6-dehydratase
MIAEVCQEYERHWIHIGSGCIYDGYEQPWHEEDEANYYGSFYSKTKIWSQDILSRYDEVLILRIRMPIDEEIQPRSVIYKLVDYAKSGKPILNEPNSMTSLNDLAKAIEYLAERGETGTWNIVSGGSLTAEQILEMYKKYVDSDLEYNIRPTQEVLGTMKSGRSNCLMSTKKLSESGLVLENIETFVERILKDVGQHAKST